MLGLRLFHFGPRSPRASCARTEPDGDHEPPVPGDDGPELDDVIVDVPELVPPLVVGLDEGLVAQE
jgi:hypothetical protein